MRTTARTSIILSPLPDRTPSEVKALMSLAAALRADQRVRHAEAELRALNPRLLADIGIDHDDVPNLARQRIVN
jgi:uncharacterized protein YjiS (DUF1127 family)